VGKCKRQKILWPKTVSPVECLLCLPVLQIYRACVYLYCKFLLTAGICTLCVSSVVAGPLFLFATMGRKKMPCTCDPACKPDAACRQMRSKTKRRQEALAAQVFALAVAVCPLLHLLTTQAASIGSSSGSSSSGRVPPIRAWRCARCTQCTRACECTSEDKGKEMPGQRSTTQCCGMLQHASNPINSPQNLVLWHDSTVGD